MSTPLPSAPLDDIDGADRARFFLTPEHVTQALVVFAIVVTTSIFTLGARWVNWPAEPGFQDSLAQPPFSIMALLLALVLLAGCTALATVLVGHRWYLAGLMAAAAGLASWSIRGGSTTYVLFRASNAGVQGGLYVQSLIELIVLFALIGALWNLIWTRHHVSELAEARDREHGKSIGAALVAQAALMTLCVLILVATTQKKQVLAGVFIAGLASTAIAERYFADRKAGRWYWIGPLMTGAVGYILNAFSPAGIEVGDPAGGFGALARAMPLDYASLGVAGAILGYWWMTPGDEKPVEEEASVESTDAIAE